MQRYNIFLIFPKILVKKCVKYCTIQKKAVTLRQNLKTMYNLAIIGGGPAGYTAAEKASKAGLSVVLFEKDSVGGTCLNVGCIPTKTLLYSAKQYYYATHADKYGIAVENVLFDYGKIVQRKTKIVRKLVAGIKAKLKDCTLVSGAATVVEHSPEKW